MRIYHAFGSGEIIREVAGMEAGYDEVKAVSPAWKAVSGGRLGERSNTDRQRLEKPSDLSPLTNPNFVHAVMSSMQAREEQARPGLEHRPRSNVQGGKPWPGLGRRVEVMYLDGSVDGAAGEMGKMSI